jgi:hypothetical protein
MMGAEPGRPKELSRSQGSIQTACDPFIAQPAAASSSRLAVAEPGSLRLCYHGGGL